MSIRRTARAARLAAALALAIAAAGCGTGTSTPSQVPGATSYEEYAAAACLAWDALFRAIGNPDTADWSEQHAALDEAVEAGNVAEAERLAAAITAELEAGRGHLAVAAGWAPAAPVMAQADRVFVAFEAMVDAKRNQADPTASGPEPQAAFESAGGLEAWFAMIEAARAMPPPAGTAAARPCPTVPVTP
jgi:hypothetical protein